MNTPEEQQKIVEAVSKKFPHMTCPMCSNTKFALVRGFTMNILSKDTTTFGDLSKAIPTASFTCENCGFLAQYSLQTLGLSQ